MNRLRIAALVLFVVAMVSMAVLLAGATNKEVEAPLELVVPNRPSVSPVASPQVSVSAVHLVQQQRPSPQPSIVVRSVAEHQKPHPQPSPETRRTPQPPQPREDALPPPTPAPQFDLRHGQVQYHAYVETLRATAVSGGWYRTDVKQRHFNVSSDAMDAFHNSEGFTELRQTVGLQCMHLRDVLALDVDQDGEYDILTVNHNAEQTLLMHTDEGFHEEERPDLSIDPALPGLAVHPQGPHLDKNGLYIYWERDRLYFYLYVAPGRIGRVSKLPNPLEVFVTVPFGPVSIFAEEKALVTDVTVGDNRDGDIQVSEIAMRLRHGSRFGVVWRRKAVQVTVLVDTDALLLPLEDIHIGHGLANPDSYQFTVALRDRHSYVAMDANGDGWQDLLILRGGLQGDINLLKYSDELLEFDTETMEYRDSIQYTGFERRAARSNQAAVGDFNGDGSKEIVVSSRNCQSAPESPRLLGLDLPGEYSRSFTDVTSDFFPPLFGVSTMAFTEFVIADMDRDGTDDIISVGPFGVHFHYFAGHSMLSVTVSDIPVFGSIDKCNAGLSTARDINGDGYPDVLLSSSTSVVLTYSPYAKAIVAFPTRELGLPADIQLARWVDYDNDGCVDVFTVPGGLYHSYSCTEAEGKGFFGAFFERTGVFEVGIPFPRNDLESSWVQWIDVDGDGSLDLAPYALKARGATSVCDVAIIALNNCSSANWLHVDVEGPTGAPICHSAEVTVVDSNGRLQTARVGAAEHSRYSQTHTRLYFGLGDFDVAEVFVRFSRGVVVSPTAVCTNCRILISHPV